MECRAYEEEHSVAGLVLLGRRRWKSGLVWAGLS
jgi:hypothetical protein